jgi:hypothetical protein
MTSRGLCPHFDGEAMCSICADLAATRALLAHRDDEIARLRAQLSPTLPLTTPEARP